MCQFFLAFVWVLRPNKPIESKKKKPLPAEIIPIFTEKSPVEAAHGILLHKIILSQRDGVSMVVEEVYSR